MSAIRTVLLNPDLLGYISDFNSNYSKTFIRAGRITGLKRRWNTLKKGGEFYTACKYGQLDIAKWYMFKCPVYNVVSYIDIAAQYGHLEMVKWLNENNNGTCVCQGMNYAAMNGHISVVKWLHENTPTTVKCTVDAIDWAIGYGHLQYGDIETYVDNFIIEAIEKGYLNIVKWLYNKHLNDNHNRTKIDAFYIMKLAVIHGRCDIVKWAYETFPDLKNADINNLIYISSTNYNREIVDYLRSIKN